MEKSYLYDKNGFTLIELLIAIAIIGIMSGVILVVTMQGLYRARLGSAVQSVRSSLPGLSDCYMRGIAISSPDNANNPTNVSCIGANQYVSLGGNSSNGCIYNTSLVATISGVANGAIQAGCRCSGVTIATCQTVFQCDFATTNKCSATVGTL